MPNNRVTMMDVAQVANVSKQTVSRVLNNKDDVSNATRERVQAVINELGYRPNVIARNLAFSRNLLIGLVFPNVDIPLFVDMIRGVEHVADQNAYHIILKETGDDGDQEQQVLAALEDFRVNGVIMVGPLMTHEELSLHLRGFEAVTLINFPNIHLLPNNITAINVDSYTSMSRLTEHLVKHGRRHFAYLNGPISFPAVERKRAIVDTLNRYDYQLDEERVLRGPYTPEFGYDAAHTLLTAHPEIDTILCFDDGMAIGAIKACIDLGRKIPDDVAVAGSQNIPFAQFTVPALTTISVPRFEIGVAAAESIFDRLNNNSVDRMISIQPEIIFRDSTP